MLTVLDGYGVPIEPYYTETGGTALLIRYYFGMGLPYTYRLGYLERSVSNTVTYYTGQTITINIEDLTPDDPDSAVQPWDPDTDWYDDSQTSFVITAPEQLAGLAKLVNEGRDFTGKTVMLGNDIDLADKPWTPIGSYAKPFDGIFDGSGHAIEGLYIKDPALSYAALFGCSTGTLKDLSVYGEVNARSSVAGIAAQAKGTITGVTNYVKLTASGDFVGGIVADAIGHLVIDDCHNRGGITHTDMERSTGRVGGIIGRVDNGEWEVGVDAGKYTIKASAEITNCSNTVDILGYQYVGGIIGGQFGEADVKACFNSGKITGVSFGKVYIGGIAGKSEGGTIDSCYNTGEIYCSHWSTGHVRGIGGIAGLEEGRAAGTTAITNCYTTGLISFRSDNIGSSGVYAVANISGGNQATDASTMRYENCFYLERMLPQGEPSHPDYAYWSIVYKNNPLAYETAYTTKVTADELKGAGVLALLNSNGTFAADEDSLNGGYPVLYWQAGTSAPGGQEYAVDAPEIIGGTPASSASTDVAKAEQGTTVTVTVVPESGKRVYKVTVTDKAGNRIAITEVSGTMFTFTMPGRGVSIEVVLENDVTGTDLYTLGLPSGLDPIWTLTAESSGYSEGRYAAGNTVFITVNKAAGANTASIGGVTLDPAVPDLNDLGAGRYGFTMPESNVSVTLIEQYAAITVREQARRALP
ncbi:MAG: hypothetical protein LBT26_02700 [Clostridiales Family XIII bacterium]|nr:hypothetical protein [Clostridiales Family XIII bacterium]